MDPLIRVLAILVLLYCIAGDLSWILGPAFQTMEGDIEAEKRHNKKTQPVRTTQDLIDAAARDEREAINILASNAAKNTLLATIRNACLPKLICELNATPHRDRLTDAEKSLLSLIKDTSISMMAEVPSKYHFAAHMGQLIAGVDGTGCHNFYPTCPFPGLKILHMMKKVKIR